MKDNMYHKLADAWGFKPMDGKEEILNMLNDYEKSICEQYKTEIMNELKNIRSTFDDLSTMDDESSYAKEVALDVLNKIQNIVESR